MHFLALSTTNFVSSRDKPVSPKIKSTQKHQIQQWKRGSSIVLASNTEDIVPWRQNVRLVGNTLANLKRNRGNTMVTSEETAGHGGSRLCLSTHVINTCSYSQHVVKQCLSLSIWSQRWTGPSVKRSTLGALICFLLILNNIQKGTVK